MKTLASLFNDISTDISGEDGTVITKIATGFTFSNTVTGSPGVTLTLYWTAFNV